MRRSDYIWPRMMHAGMNRERCSVQRMLAFDYFALRVHQHQVRHADLTEMHSERVHPKMIGPLRIARGDVAGNAFIEAKLGEQAKSGRQPLLAVPPLFFHRCEFSRSWEGGILDRRSSSHANLRG